MSNASSGVFGTRVLADGSRAFRLRFHVGGKREIVTLHERTGCDCGCGCGWDEPSAHTELGNTLARIRVGVWRRPQPPVGSAENPPGERVSFHEYASRWLQAKIDGVLSEKPIDSNTEADYRWRLSCHLLPFFASHSLAEIDRELCLRFKAHKLHEAHELREAIDAGADIRDQRGRRRVPLSPASIRKLIDTLAAILDDAIEDGHIDHNPARGKRMRVRVPSPTAPSWRWTSWRACWTRPPRRISRCAKRRPPRRSGRPQRSWRTCWPRASARSRSPRSSASPSPPSLTTSPG
jgi:hypothetical protein